MLQYRVCGTLACNRAIGDVTRPVPSDWPVTGISLNYPASDALRRLPVYNIPFNLAIDLSTTCRVNLSTPRQRALVNGFVRVLVQEVLTYVRRARNTGTLDVSQRDAFTLAPVLDLRDAQQRIGAGLRVWLAAIAKQFLTSAQFVGSARTNAFLIGKPERVAAAYAQQMQRRVTQSMGGSLVRHVLPHATTDDIDHLMRDLSVRLHAADKIYRVIGIVDGLDLAGKSLQLGTVRLYDARTWEYGESNTLDSVAPSTYRGSAERYGDMDWSTLEQVLGGIQAHANQTFPMVRHSARALVVVDAADEGMARDRAEIAMQAALDMLTFAYAAHREDRRHARLTILRSFTVTTPTSSRTFINNDPLDAGTLTADDASFTKLVATYHILLNRPLPAQTPLEQAVLRTVHWLARGYWEIYLPDRLLNYWIAIEQLLVLPEDKKGAGVRERLPQLVAPWFANTAGQAVVNKWRELVQEIERYAPVRDQLDANATFAQWRTVGSVLLGRIDHLITLDTTQMLQSPRALKALMDRDQIIALQTRQTDDVKYRVDLLYAQRNKIAHEGASYRTDLEWYTAALWGDAHTVVVRILDRVVAQPGHFMSITDVIADQAIPF